MWKKFSSETIYFCIYSFFRLQKAKNILIKYIYSINFQTSTCELKSQYPIGRLVISFHIHIAPSVPIFFVKIPQLPFVSRKNNQWRFRESFHQIFQLIFIQDGSSVQVVRNGSPFLPSQTRSEPQAFLRTFQVGFFQIVTGTHCFYQQTADQQ